MINILFKAAKSKVETREEFTVTNVLEKDGQVYGITGKNADGQTEKITAKVVVAADGCNSIILRKLNLYESSLEHVMVATRAYYKNVKEMTNAIELHFVDSVNPGYFWIFPLENGLANVGIGMVKNLLKKNNINLKEAHDKAVNSPEFKERFADAELQGDIVAWNLPTGSKKKTNTWQWLYNYW